MKIQRELKTISDDDLLRGLSELLKNSRRVEAELVAHISEVDCRRLYARTSSSMFTYCTRVLHMSEYEAYSRIKAARAVRKHPVLLDMLADGRLHLSGIVLLRPHLTKANRDSVLKRAIHQSKRRIKELIAEISPKPDVPATIRKLPKILAKTKPSPMGLQGPDPVRPPSTEQTEPQAPATPPPSAPPKRPAEMEPLAPARYKITFTASTELRDKLEKLRSLMRSSVADGDLAAVIEEAVTDKIEKLESKRYGKTKNPRKGLEDTDTTASSRYLPTPIRRAVVERDQYRCTFVDESGHRCDETEWLEFHHVEPYGRGGDRSLDNIYLVCRTHNLYLAECDYGKELMERYRNSGGRVSETTAVYTFSNRATPTHWV
jgi:hypothetical protein